MTFKSSAASIVPTGTGLVATTAKVLAIDISRTGIALNRAIRPLKLAMLASATASATGRSGCGWATIHGKSLWKETRLRPAGSLGARITDTACKFTVPGEPPPMSAAIGPINRNVLGYCTVTVAT